MTLMYLLGKGKAMLVERHVKRTVAGQRVGMHKTAFA